MFFLNLRMDFKTGCIIIIIIIIILYYRNETINPRVHNNKIHVEVFVKPVHRIR